MTKPQFIMLIGAPGSGKSTWTNNFLKIATGDWVVISSDAFIDEYAEKHNLTYSEAFDKVDFNDINKKININVKQAFNTDTNIIWDQTNMSIKARAKKLKKVPDNYERTAISFILDSEELQERLDKRERETGKKIPKFVVTSMLDNYNPPTEEEGFTIIKTIP